MSFIDEYDEELSHLIISGSDIMLCPSFDDHVHQVPVSVTAVLSRNLESMEGCLNDLIVIFQIHHLHFKLFFGVI